jgi:hypothetical protein
MQRASGSTHIIAFVRVGKSQQQYLADTVGVWYCFKSASDNSVDADVSYRGSLQDKRHRWGSVDVSREDHDLYRQRRGIQLYCLRDE